MIGGLSVTHLNMQRIQKEYLYFEVMYIMNYITKHPQKVLNKYRTLQVSWSTLVTDLRQATGKGGTGFESMNL
jgi:hypothetical protein